MLRRRPNPYRELEDVLGYRFRDRDHLEAALVHRSYRFETQGVHRDNQRLEFLGDAVLGLLAAEHLYAEFGEADEGRLTALRSRVSSGGALAQVARGLDLGRYLHVGRGEERSGGRTRPSNLADAMEAVIGAVYLDGGMRAARRVFQRVFAEGLEKVCANLEHANPKGRLQELSQRRWKKSPVYRVLKETGPAHQTRFTVAVEIDGRRRATGEGGSKQDAERRAAAAALLRIGD